MSGAVLRNLARATRHHVLVTLSAALRVVDRTETIGDPLDLLEDEAVVVVRTQRLDRPFLEALVRRPLHQISVGAIVEPGRGFTAGANRPVGAGRRLAI